MAGILDLINAGRAAEAPGPAPEPGLGDLFGQGLRSGALDMRGKLNKLAGTTMDAVGLDGSSRNAASLRDQALAQVEGRDLVPFKDADIGRQGLRYAAGMAGQMAPMAAATVGAGALTALTGGGAGAALLAGTALQAPVEIGGQLQRQDRDDANNAATPGAQLMNAVPTGLASAAVQNIVPAGVAARMVGKGGAATLGQVGARALADIPANAAASAASEGIHQFGDNQLNPNAGYDTHAIKEAGYEGAAGGAMFAAAGGAGHALHSSGAALKAAPGRAIDAAKGLVPEKVSQAAGEAVDKAGEVAKDLPTTLSDVFESAKDGATGLLNKMADGREVADPTAPDQARAQGEADQTTFQMAKQWASELADENLSPENAAKLKQAAGDLGDKVNQQTVATIKRGQDAIAEVKGAAVRFNDAVKSRMAESDAGSAKKSEDYSGSRKAIGDAVMSVLGEDHPVFQSPEGINNLADGLRPFIARVASGKALDSFEQFDHLTKLFDVTGDKTGAVLKAVHDAVGDPTTDKAAFFDTLNQIGEVQKGRTSVLDAMQKNLAPELQDSVRPSQLRELTDKLQTWANDKGVSLKSKDEAKFHDERVVTELKQFFGDKVDVVLAAVEKNRKAEENWIAGAHGDPEMTSEDGKSSVKYFGQNKQLYLHPDRDKGGVTKDGMKYDGAASQAMKRAERDNPGAAITFKKASEIGLDNKMVKAKHADLMDEARTHGLDEEQAKAHADKTIDNFGVVTAEAAKDAAHLNSAELDGMRLDTKAFGKSPSRINAGEGLDGKPVILDAIKLVKTMREKLKDQFTTNDDTSTLARTVNAFKEGIAAVQALTGKTFELPDSTVITAGKNGVTWGEAQRITRDALRTDSDKASDSKTQEINRLRAEFRAADTLKEKAAIAKEGKKLVGDKQWDVTKELGANDDYQPPKITKREDGVREITRREPRKEDDDGLRSDNVHEDLKGEGELTTDKQPGMKVGVKEVSKGDDAAVIRTNSGGEWRNDTVMGRRKPATSVEGPSDPKAVAAKQAAFLEKARSGDKALIDQLSKSDDAKGLQRAVEHLVGEKGAGAEKTAATINARIAELVQRDGVALGMQGKKYSLMSTAVHDDLGRGGFAATHDSPIKHEGKFDWRTHAMKGEGAMVKGAGTYLSTSDAVHRYYKAQFTAVTDKSGLVAHLRDARDVLDNAKSEHAAAIKAREAGGWEENQRGEYKPKDKSSNLRFVVERDGEWGSGFVAVHAEHGVPLGGEHKTLQGVLDAMLGDKAVGPYKDAVDAAQKNVDRAKKDVENEGVENSPTYHLSVDIKPEQLLGWDKPLSDQSPAVRETLQKAIKDNGLDAEDKWSQTSSAQYEANGRDGELFHIKQSGERFFLYDDDQRAYGTYRTLDEAKKAAVDQELIPNFSSDARGEDIYRALSEKLGGDREASDYLQAHGILGHEMKAAGKDGAANPNYVIYDDSKINTNYVHFSQERADPNAMGPVDRKAVEAHIDKVLGPDVKVAWEKILHAGEFDRTAAGDVIRLSVHALNPMSVAFHESMHGLFARLKDAKQSDISAVLEKAGSSAPVMNQLRELLKGEHDALKQLADPEERAAYMYQFWAQDRLNLGPQATGVFQRIAKFIREVTGLWTNDERAEKIMAYFHSGEYEANRGDPNAVSRAINPHARAIEQLKQMTKPVREIGEALATAGGARLRDTGIPALRELADAMKLKTTSEGKDSGFLPAARSERSRVMNQIGTDLKPYGKDAIAEALDAMQTGVKATSLAARTVAKIVQKHLDDQLKYMQDAGVDIKAIGHQDGVPYFPRSWDASYISGHQREFMAMLTNAGVKDPRTTMQKMMVTDGAEFHIETTGLSKPGMQNAKQRLLTMVSHADAAPFMRKNMFEILNGYVTQATRRAEWAKRFGDDGAGVTAMIDKAAKQGATPEQLESARKFVQAVDGTLGDNIDPTTRRMFGNMIVYQNLRLLPLAIFSSAVDSQGIMVRGGTMGEAFSTFKRGITEISKNFKKDATSDRMTQLAETLGTVDSAMLVHTLGASYSQGMVGNKGRAMNDSFFRFNLMEQYNTSMRVGATEAAMNFLVRHSQQPGQHSVRFLRELGLDASDVQVDSNGRPKLLQSDGLTLEHSAKMKAAVNRWVDGAILRPDAVDKPVWMSDPHYALIAHLKQFVFSFHETILKRIAHEAAHGNYSPAMALAGYVPMMIAADLAKGLIQGGGEQPSWKANWGISDYVWSAMERAGLFGVGQFGIDVAGDIHHGGAGLGMLAGPTLGQFGEAAQVLGGRESFKSFAVKSLPANALYATALKAEASDPKFAD